MSFRDGPCLREGRIPIRALRAPVPSPSSRWITRGVAQLIGWLEESMSETGMPCRVFKWTRSGRPSYPINYP